MNELELVVEDRTGNQRVLIGAAQPCQQIVHELRYAPSGRADVLDCAAAHHTNAGAAIMSGRVQQSAHQDFVSTQQVGFASRVPLLVLIVGFDGVAGFLNVPERRDNGLAIENGRNLLLAEDIAFNG